MSVILRLSNFSAPKPLSSPLFSLQVEATDTPVPYAAVLDGHGGNACSDWLSNNFSAYLDIYWESGAAPVAAITQAFLVSLFWNEWLIDCGLFFLFSTIIRKKMYSNS